MLKPIVVAKDRKYWTGRVLEGKPVFDANPSKALKFYCSADASKATGGWSEAGVEFLGSQGDVWDAQEDMLADTLGAVFAVALFWIVRRRLPVEPDRAGSYRHDRSCGVL